jgi:hypothetical protein
MENLAKTLFCRVKTEMIQMRQRIVGYLGGLFFEEE